MTLAQAVITAPVILLSLALTVSLGGLLYLIVGRVLLHRRLDPLRRQARRLADGDVSARLSPDGPRSLADLADSLNRIAALSDDRLAAVARQRSAVDAVLASMTEGVLALDADQRLISINPAARRLLALDTERSLGRLLPEVVRNTALHQLAQRTLDSDTPIQSDLSLRVPAEERPGSLTDRHFQVVGTPLRDQESRRLGALLVMHDVTRLRRLETVRKDFVANVSHEIKTPVSAIKAAVETLQDDAEREGFSPDAVRFLEIIARQSDRLHSIIQDLLTLARVEQDTEEGRVPMEEVLLHEVLTAAVEGCRMLAEARTVGVECRCPEDIALRANSRLLEQAVVNLLDNAIKYSPEGQTVQVRAEVEQGQVVVSVTDHGPGIEPQHQQRIFERFYRTDPARSRALGGTGLGLAIVKHAAQAHAGRVWVHSTPGQGSTFHIRLPLPVHAEVV